MPENVRVYLLQGFDPKGIPAERSGVSRRFAADSIRRYLEEDGREAPEGALRGVAAGAEEDGAPAFVYGSQGKPFLANPALTGVYFSLSHTQGLAVCAVSNREIGCDVERPLVRDMAAERCVKIAKRFFAPDEIEELLPDPARFFFPIWTKKEAYVKWTGRGLAEGLSSFSVFGLPSHIVCENIRLAEAEDAVCAVCYEKES